MDEQIQQLSKQVAKQGEEIAELKRRLNRNSRNSSTPPSQDPPGAPERKRPDPSGRSQGAQPGHRGKGESCCRSRRSTGWWSTGRGAAAAGTASPRATRRPASPPAARSPSCPRSPWRSPSTACTAASAPTAARRPAPSCRRTCRPAPSGLAWKRRWRRSRSATASRAATRSSWWASCSAPGWRAARSTRSSPAPGEALAEPYEDLLARIRSAPALNVDETGWKLRGAKRTLWGAVTSRAAVFRIAPDRHEREAAALLGRGLRRHRRLRSLVGLPRLRSEAPPSLLVAPDQRPDRPLRRARRPEGVRRAGARHSQASVLGLG